jgi:hypothetical protein
MTPGRNFRRNDNTMNPNPIAAITSNINILKCMSNHNAKFITENSSMISQIPLVIKNLLLPAMSFLFFMEIKAEVPERKTKTGAQKWVIHRVRKSNVVVVDRFKGSWVRESMCIKSRV